MKNKKVDVFISYHMDSSERLVDTISSALEDAGISVWYAAKDIDGAYAGQIVDAINQCRVFLLILNEKSALSGHCLNEFNIAFNKFNQQKDVTIIPFKIAEFDLNKEAYYYLNRMRIFDGSLPPEVVRVRELIERIKNVLGNKEQIVSFVNDEELQVVKEYRLVSSDVNSDTQFVGRKKELEAIREMLRERNKLFLVGMGGIGKSEIARTYAFLNKDAYDVVVWVSFKDSLAETFANDSSFLIEGLNRSDYQEESAEDYFRRKLKLLKTMGSERVLLVIDNFDVDYDAHLEELCEIPCSILFTTRNRPKSTKYQKLEIGAIRDKEDLMALFRIEYLKDLEEEELEWVDRILELLNGHPLSIRLVASAMQANRIRPKKMYDLLKDGSVAMKERNEDAAEEIYGQLKKVFRLSMLSEDELYILKNLALLPLSGVEVEMFAGWCDLDGYKTVDRLIGKSWIVHNSASDEMHLHPLVADLMLEELARDISCCDTLIDSIIKKRQKILNTKYKFKRKLVEVLTSVSEKLPAEHPRYFEVLYNKALVIFDLSMYNDAIRELTGLFEMTDDPEIKLDLYNKVSHINCLSGNPERAVEIIQEAFAYAEALPPEQVTRRITNFVCGLEGRISEAYRGTGEYDLAVKYARKKLAETPEKCISDNMELEIGWAHYHLARILFMRREPGDLEESEQLFQDAISIFEVRKDKWSQAFCHDILSQIYMLQGDFEQAQKEIQMEYDILHPQLGDVHVDIAVNYQMRGNIYRHFNQEEEALKYYRKAIEILEKLGIKRTRDKLIEIMNSGEIGYLS